MMEYEVFKEAVKEQFLDYMPDKFANYTVRVQSVRKVNEEVDQLALLPLERKGEMTIPSLSIRSMYEDYKAQGNFSDVMAIHAFEYVGAYKNAPKNVAEKIFHNVKDKIVMTLINTEQNRELLKGVPHREIHDLSMVYRVLVGKDKNGIQSALVQNKYAKQIGFDEEMLYQAAVKNTAELFPPVVKGMSQIVKELFMMQGMKEEQAEAYFGTMAEQEKMFIITNERGVHGAVSMLYEGVLHELAEKLDSDLYILPSSIHETIAVSTKEQNPYELAAMVTDINMGEVGLNERLSNQVYHYDKDLRKLTLATHTPNQSLEGSVEEKKTTCNKKMFR